MDANDRPLDLTADEKSQIADMLARRGAGDATGRLELEVVRGAPIGGWLHLRFGGQTVPATQ